MVCVADDPAASLLPEDGLQLAAGNRLRLDEVLQHVAGSDAGKLVDIAHQHDGALIGDGPKELVHQRKVDHRHLVENEHVPLKRLLGAVFEGVAVGVESVDDDNCLSVGKRQNVGQPFPEAVCRANEMGIQVDALLMVGLPHDTPENLVRTQGYLEKVPCALYDLRILRIYPGSPLYDKMLSSGNVADAWWLGKEPVTTNYFLPGHLRVHFKHPHFTPMQLQRSTLKLTSELDRMNAGAVANVMRVGRRGGAKMFAGLILAARSRVAKQARELLTRVEQSMETEAANP